MVEPSRGESNPVYVPDALDFAWFCGLFEGEGCITSQAGRPRLILVTTDEDVARRAHASIGCGMLYGPYTRPDGRKPGWRVDVYGRPASELLKRLLPHFGERRRDKALEVLADEIETRCDDPGRDAHGRFVAGARA